MKIEITVEKTKTGYFAYAEKYLVNTVGTILEELKANMLEALNFILRNKAKVLLKQI